MAYKSMFINYTTKYLLNSRMMVSRQCVGIERNLRYKE